jgi:hypothetical protein
MNFLQKILGKKDKSPGSYEKFWNWFCRNEKAFFKTVKEHDNIERKFFRKLAPKLAELKDGFWYLTGMYDDNTAELVITVDGTIKNIVFAEELIDSAPEIEGWKFTALKPAIYIESLSIKMADYQFHSENMSFYSNDDPDYPDEIDITVVHNDLDDKNKPAITNGIYIFLDNYLGELNFATTIDNLTIAGRNEAEKELIPIAKLKNFLAWRQKEFIEKYEGLRHKTKEDSYSILEAELESGRALIAVINTNLLEWDSKASHPWIMSIEIKYDRENNNGMPDKATGNLLSEIENSIMEELKDFDGYLNIGRQTAEGIRKIYFACKDFRKPSKVLHGIQGHYTNRVEINYDIYKDKYWQSLERFNNNSSINI